MSLFRKTLSLLLIIALVFQVCPLHADAYADGFVIIQEGKLEETLITEELHPEILLQPQYIQEHLIYEDGIYEYKYGEQLITEVFLYEVTITPETITNLVEILPHQFDEYNIDWPSVIAKFAIGTTIIIAVGVVHHITKGVSSFFIMATPGGVTKDAFIGGAIGAVLNIAIHNDGVLPDRAVAKYAIEGYADGYMWGAITSVLKIGVKNFKRLKMFKKANGGALKIRLNGEVLNESGEVIGKAYYDSSKLWHLVDETNGTITSFNAAGKEIPSLAGSNLPANKVLRLGTDTDFKKCYTDATGQIYRVDNALKPNITYRLGDAIYKTDSLGRITSVEFDHLVMKAADQPRMIIADTMEAIGKNSAKLTDQRGHLIADMFKGDNSLANIVPQSQKVNQSVVKEIEMNWAKALSNGQNVSGSIQLSYKGSSFRPTDFKYTYNSGSGWIEKIIPNK